MRLSVLFLTGTFSLTLMAAPPAEMESGEDLLKAIQAPLVRSSWTEPSSGLGYSAFVFKNSNRWVTKIEHLRALLAMLNRLSPPQIESLSPELKEYLFSNLNREQYGLSQVRSAIISPRLESLKTMTAAQSKQAIAEIYTASGLNREMNGALDLLVKSIHKNQAQANLAHYTQNAVLPSNSAACPTFSYPFVANYEPTERDFQRWLEEVQDEIDFTLKGANKADEFWLAKEYADYGILEKSRLVVRVRSKTKLFANQLSEVPLFTSCAASPALKDAFHKAAVAFLVKNQKVATWVGGKVSLRIESALADEKDGDTSDILLRDTQGVSPLDRMVLSLAFGGFQDEVPAADRKNYYAQALSIYEDALKSITDENLRTLIVAVTEYLKKAGKP